MNSVSHIFNKIKSTNIQTHETNVLGNEEDNHFLKT